MFMSAEDTPRVTADDSQRPWGRYEILQDTPTFKVKTIWVEPGHRLSLQRHQKRQEHWFIVSGVADVVLGEEEFKRYPNETVDVAVGQLHRIGNSGTEVMVFVEVQTGTYFGEDDIERIQDDYAR
jgi:mannose-6-phosphate isomerase